MFCDSGEKPSCDRGLILTKAKKKNVFASVIHQSLASVALVKRNVIIRFITFR